MCECTLNIVKSEEALYCEDVTLRSLQCAQKLNKKHTFIEICNEEPFILGGRIAQLFNYARGQVAVIGQVLAVKKPPEGNLCFFLHSI